ncbi:MAG: D-alanine--D-alanine ligase [Ignavibacteria bacterium]|nr:D-alanine--D-alanine ligase [Ignavibacteria bacterium]
MNIALLTGGLSAEREVSLSSGRGILKALRSLGHNVIVIDPIYGDKRVDEDVIFQDVVSKDYPALEKIKKLQGSNARRMLDCVNSDLFDNIDMAFLGLHGKFGEDGKIQTLLELRGIKYTGSGITASTFAMDKDIAKTVFKENGISTPEWIALKREDEYNIKEFLRIFGKPLVIKPNDEGSTVGLTIASDEKELEKGIKLAFSYSDKILVEKHVKGRELTVSIVDGKAYPVVEIKPKEGFYDYEHKYTKGKTEYVCPAVISAAVSDKAKEIALNAFELSGCDVYARVDFLLTADDELSCLEVNTLPGMTELSLVPMSVRAEGMEFNVLIDTIIKASLKKYV